MFHLLSTFALPFMITGSRPLSTKPSSNSSDKWFVYLIRCSDNSIYTGVTTDVERRVKEHNESKRGAKYTKTRRPVSLIKSFEVSTKSEALKMEYRIKQLSRAEKLAFQPAD